MKHQSMGPGRTGGKKPGNSKASHKTRRAHQKMGPGAKRGTSGAATGFDTVKTAYKPRDCYITGACVTSLGLADDCDDLRLLRRFRETYVAHLPDGPELLAEYRRRAPVIVAAIDALGATAARVVYRDIHESGVAPAMDLIRAGHWHEALSLYRSIRDELARRFEPDLDIDAPAGAAAPNRSRKEETR